MPCKIIGPKKQKLCIGQMKELITIKVRYIVPPEDVDYNIVFSDSLNTYAAIETTTGTTVFDEVNGDQPVTHKFYSRYIKNVTFEDWIEHEGNNYRILSVENIHERNQYLIFRAQFKGSATIAANSA